MTNKWIFEEKSLEQNILCKLKEFTLIQHVEFHKCRLTRAVLTTLGKLHPETLVFRSCTFPEKRGLSRLSTCSSLVHLSLNSCRLSPKQWEELRMFKHLMKLDLQWVPTTSEQFLTLVDLPLTRLGLVGTGLTNEDLNQFWSTYQQTNPNPKHQLCHATGGQPCSPNSLCLNL
jgi:hypothetical protein